MAVERLDMARTFYSEHKRYTSRDVQVLMALFENSGAEVTGLSLLNNRITDVGMQALVDAIDRGVMPKLDSIDVDNNPASEKYIKAVYAVLKARPFL